MDKKIEKEALKIVRNNNQAIDESENYFIKSILSDKKNCFSFYNYGTFLFQLKRYHQAEKCFLKCLKINSTFKPALQSVNFFYFLFFIFYFFLLFFIFFFTFLFIFLLKIVGRFVDKNGSL